MPTVLGENDTLNEWNGMDPRALMPLGVVGVDGEDKDEDGAV